MLQPSYVSFPYLDQVKYALQLQINRILCALEHRLLLRKPEAMNGRYYQCCRQRCNTQSPRVSLHSGSPAKFTVAWNANEIDIQVVASPLAERTHRLYLCTGTTTKAANFRQPRYHADDEQAMIRKPQLFTRLRPFVAGYLGACHSPEHACLHSIGPTWWMVHHGSQLHRLEQRHVSALTVNMSGPSTVAGATYNPLAYPHSDAWRP